MPSKDPAQRFEDILTNIQRIEFHIARIANETAFEENATGCRRVPGFGNMRERSSYGTT